MKDENDTNDKRSEDDVVVQTETSKIKKDKVKCEECEYKCKKESTLRKQMNTKHGDKECKENTKLQDSDTVRL